MDELEFLTSLRPSVEPPDRDELEAMWSAVIDGDVPVGSSDGPFDPRDVVSRPRSRRRLVAAIVVVLVLSGGGLAAMIGSLRTTSVDVVAGPSAEKALDGEPSQSGSPGAQTSSGGRAYADRASSLTAAVGACPPISSEAIARSASAFVGMIRDVDAVHSVVTIDVDHSLRGDAGPELILDLDPRWIAMWSSVGPGPLLVTIDGAERPMDDPRAGWPCSVVESWSPEREAEWREVLG